MSNFKISQDGCKYPVRMEFQTVDGSWCKSPVAWCHRYKAYLSNKQTQLHGCYTRHKGICRRLQAINRDGDVIGGVKVTIEQQINSKLDKILDNAVKARADLSRIQKDVRRMREIDEQVLKEVREVEDFVPNSIDEESF